MLNSTKCLRKALIYLLLRAIQFAVIKYNLDFTVNLFNNTQQQILGLLNGNLYLRFAPVVCSFITLFLHFLPINNFIMYIALLLSS